MDVDELADEAFTGGDDDFAVAAGAAHELSFAAFGGGFEENFFGGADEGLVAGKGGAPEDVEEDLVARFFDFLGDGIAEWGCRGIRSRAVFEKESHVETDIFEVPTGELEVCLGFSGEADDDIGGDIDIRSDGADFIDNGTKFFDRVGSAHGFEDAVATALHGEVQIFAEFREARVALDEVVFEADGVRAGKADALDAVDSINFFEKLNERAFFVAEGKLADGILVDDLAKEGDFAGAFAGEFLDFFDDGFHRSGAFGSAGFRHDTVAAFHVASLHNADESGDLRRAVNVGTDGVLRTGFFLQVDDGGWTRSLAAQGGEHVIEMVGHAMEFLRADHKVQVGEAVD